MFNLQRRQIRDMSNPFEIPEDVFRRLYRAPRGLVMDFINEVSPFLTDSIRITSVSKHLKIL